MNVWNSFRTKQAKESRVKIPISWNSNHSIFTEKRKTSLEIFSFRLVMPPNFNHFRPKVGFKIALESFTSSSWRLRTALILIVTDIFLVYGRTYKKEKIFNRKLFPYLLPLMSNCIGSKKYFRAKFTP